MMDVDPIRNIEKVIKLQPGQKILRQKVKNLTAPGENYGSLMLSVDLEVSTPNGTEEIHAVGKKLPPNDFMQEVFNTKVTYRNEAGFYKVIFPVLQAFQREHGVEKVIDFAPKYYGSRLNLADDDKTLDSDAVILLENLKIQNYVTLDRAAGLDVEVTKIILNDLAHLHGVSLALKLQKPDVFEEKIKPFLVPWQARGEHYQKLLKDLIRLIDQTEELIPYKEKLVNEWERQMAWKPSREAFATIAHNDCWTNNNMVKFDGSKPVANKLVDYQTCSYGSPAKDVIFLLFSSVKPDVLHANYNNFIKYYYQVFRSVLEELHCDPAPFSFEAFQEELDYEARNSQFAHVAFMMFVIVAPKEKVKEVKDMTPENLVSEDISDLLKERFIFFVNKFVENGWLNLN